MNEYGILDYPSVVFAIILFILWWIGGSFAIRIAAMKKGLDGGAWLLCSLALGPILTALLVIIHPAIPIPDDDY